VPLQQTWKNATLLPNIKQAKNSTYKWANKNQCGFHWSYFIPKSVEVYFTLLFEVVCWCIQRPKQVPKLGGGNSKDFFGIFNPIPEKTWFPILTLCIFFKGVGSTTNPGNRDAVPEPGAHFGAHARLIPLMWIASASMAQRSLGVIGDFGFSGPIALGDVGILINLLLGTS